MGLYYPILTVFVNTIPNEACSAASQRMSRSKKRAAGRPYKKCRKKRRRRVPNPDIFLCPFRQNHFRGGELDFMASEKEKKRAYFIKTYGCLLAGSLPQAQTRPGTHL